VLGINAVARSVGDMKLHGSRHRMPPIREAARRTAFIRAFLKDPVRVASVIETSPRTIRAALDTVNLADASCVVELGAGTGPFTEQLVERIGSQARLLAFEISSDLAKVLQQRISDPRLTVINDRAERLLDYVGPHEVDVVACELPLAGIGQEARDAMLARVVSALKPDGIMLIVQYTRIRRHDFERFFGTVRAVRPRTQLWPVVVWICGQPRLEMAATAHGVDKAGASA
jgi:phospholipid N-methyltransferase